MNPVIGVGVIIENEKGEILVGKRKGSIAPYWSIPGGGMEYGETFESVAIREVMEETGIEIKSPKVIGLSNNLETFFAEGFHSVSVSLYTKVENKTPKIMEPDKCEAWMWCNPKELPKPHFEASLRSIECFLQDQFYIPKVNIQQAK